MLRIFSHSRFSLELGLTSMKAIKQVLGSREKYFQRVSEMENMLYEKIKEGWPNYIASRITLCIRFL